MMQQQQHRVDESMLIHGKMLELRLICEREISVQEHRHNTAKIAFRNSLQSIKLNVQQASADQANLGKLKAQLREVEDDLVKALAVKTRKEAKHIALTDSASAAKARREEIEKVLQDQKCKKDNYAAIQELALETLEERANKGIKQKQDTEEVISWYNRVLGFRVEAGRGIKFIFNNVNLKNPNEEYSFTIRHANDTYTLLECHPPLNYTKVLIKELNQTNGLFNFVRTMREKFQAAASTGFPSPQTSINPESSIISLSAPASSFSVDESESPASETEFQAQTKEHSRSPKRVNRGRAGKSAILSLGSGSSLRLSSRSKYMAGEKIDKLTALDPLNSKCWSAHCAVDVSIWITIMIMAI